MAPQPSLPNVALTQLYFVDCCRNQPDYLDGVSEAVIGKVFDVQSNSSDKRRISIYYSTIPGQYAVAVDGRESIYCQALLHALGTAVDPGRAYTKEPVWAVTTDHLKRAMDRFLSNTYPKAGFDDLPPEGVAARADICTLPAPPSIGLTIEATAAPPAGASVDLVDINNHANSLSAVPNGGSSSWSASVPMGVWKLSVQANGANVFTSLARPVDYDVILPWQWP
jgi:hypothetical protein